jgi:transposase InsO family protein
VNDALTMAASSRSISPETILHSDHGSQPGLHGYHRRLFR